MSLVVDGKTLAIGEAKGKISRQPTEDFCVGFDNGAPVGDYKKDDNSLKGSITGISMILK